MLTSRVDAAVAERADYSAAVCCCNWRLDRTHGQRRFASGVGVVDAIKSAKRPTATVFQNTVVTALTRPHTVFHRTWLLPGITVTYFAQRFFIFSYFSFFYFGSCDRLSWLNCELSSARYTASLHYITLHYRLQQRHALTLKGGQPLRCKYGHKIRPEQIPVKRA